MEQPWYVDVFTAGIVVLWMGWSLAAIQQHGPTAALVLSNLVIGILGVLAIHGQYVTYFQLGEWVVIGRDPPRERGDGTELSDEEK